MSTVAAVQIDLALVLGQSHMPVHQLLRMGRGAVIELDASENGPFTILANNHPVAEAEILVDGDRIRARVSTMLKHDHPADRSSD